MVRRALEPDTRVGVRVHLGNKPEREVRQLGDGRFRVLSAHGDGGFSGADDGHG